ncbi:hypothetical protein K438DRAFT_1961749 [Mycena galopus ATCC 62051]|nr:hypothetical protein K438DRAFT_1961749 [Mycena galopus ATCC 62051]
MFFFLTCVLSSLFLPAACQIDDSDSDGFHPDNLTAGLFAVLCIFALLYSVLLLWNFVALITSRGHRSPYAFLLPTLFFASWSNATYIAWIILENIPALEANDPFSSELPALLLPSLGFVSNIFSDWMVVLQFLVIIAILWNRETVLRTTTEGRFGGHHPALIALHAALATLTFTFGTASEALGMATTVKYINVDLFELEEFGLDGDFNHRRLVQQQLYYVFNAFAVLMVIDVAVTTALLWRAWKKAGMPDKITNLMLYVLVPLYSIYGLLLMIFTIVFSPSGLPDTAAPTVFESADIASSVLITGTIIAIFFFILSMSGRKPYWNPGGVGLPPKQQQYWTPQAPYVYGSPVQVSQGGYYADGPQQAVPYGQPQMNQGPGTVPMQQVQYAQPHEHTPGL